MVKDMKVGRIVQMVDGSGVVEDLDGNLLPATDAKKTTRKSGESVAFEIEDVGVVRMARIAESP
jgi:hypothetical protein